MHPEAFKVFGFSIYWYGILAAIGFLTAFWSGTKRAAQENLPKDAVTNLAPWIIFGAIIGARLFFVITFWREEFANKPLHHIITVGRHGLVFYGGLVGSSLGTIIYCWKNKLPLWKISDVMAPSIALGHAFGRIGCLMTGCCYGNACTAPWAVHFPLDHATKGAAVHPVQLYESALNFAFYALLVFFFRRKKFDGQVFSIYLVGYAILRAFTETFRGDYEIPKGGLTPGQSTGVIILAIGAALWFWLSNRPQGKRAPAPVPPPAHG